MFLARQYITHHTLPLKHAAAQQSNFGVLVWQDTAQNIAPYMLTGECQPDTSTVKHKSGVLLQDTTLRHQQTLSLIGLVSGTTLQAGSDRDAEAGISFSIAHTPRYMESLRWSVPTQHFHVLLCFVCVCLLYLNA